MPFSAILAALALVQAAAASAAPSGPPAALRPAKVAGPGLYVIDLEAQKAWYMAKLGLQVMTALPQYGEYVMSFGSNPTDPVLALQKSAKRPPGANLNSRVIIGAPDAKGLAAWLKTQGVDARVAIPDVAYFITDPEGNPIELYTPPKAK